MDKYYLGYVLVTAEMGSEGGGSYEDFTICRGDTPENAVKDYLKKNGMKYNPNKLHIDFDDGYTQQFHYRDYFSTYFIELPHNATCPGPLALVEKDLIDRMPKFGVGDTVYLIRNEYQLRCRCSCSHFRMDEPTKPVERKIVSITITQEGIQYQLSGCGIHISEKDIGSIVFEKYSDAAKAMGMGV